MHTTHKPYWRSKFWWRWIGANAIAELIGLGTVAAVGFFALSHATEPANVGNAVTVAGAFVMLGAFEGAVVGVAQRAVLIQELPALHGWVRATVVGAMLAWAIGMVPSTLMNIGHSAGAEPLEEPAIGAILLLAAALGAVTGPLLAMFQWLELRKVLPSSSEYWLAANAAAWALGMPVIFVGAQINEFTSDALFIAGTVALTLLLAGGIVGAVHGRILLWLLSRHEVRRLS